MPIKITRLENLLLYHIRVIVIRFYAIFGIDLLRTFWVIRFDSCPRYHSTAHNISQILFIFGSVIDLKMHMNPVDTGISLLIFWDPVALWNFMNTLTELFLVLGWLRVCNLWTLFFKYVSLAIKDYIVTKMPSFKIANSFLEYLMAIQGKIILHGPHFRFKIFTLQCRFPLHMNGLMQKWLNSKEPPMKLFLIETVTWTATHS